MVFHIKGTLLHKNFNRLSYSVNFECVNFKGSNDIIKLFSEKTGLRVTYARKPVLTNTLDPVAVSF